MTDNAEKPKEEKTTDAEGLPFAATTEKDKQAADLDQLVDKLLQQKDELFEEIFLSEGDKGLIKGLPKKHQEPIRDALLKKGLLFRKLRERLQRACADYANFQKRVPKQLADAIGYEKETIIRTLLPVLDNFGRTLQNAHSAENIDSVVKGVKIIYDQMLDTLRSHGVEQIKAVGEKFEPTLHEAITQRDEPGKEEGVVLEEFAKGYKLNGRVIRPSKVIVNKATPAAQEKKPPPKQTTGEEETTDTE